MFNVVHYGLFFTEQHVQRAQRRAKRAPFKSAWENLRLTAGDTPLEQLHRAALRYRLDADQEAGERASSSVSQSLMADSEAELSPLTAVSETLVLTQSVELLRDHHSARLDLWLDALFERIDQLNKHDENQSLPETLWFAALNTAAGVVLEHEPAFATGTAVFRQTIDTHIHPEGYIPAVVEGEPGDSLRNQIMCVKALVLIAEIAQHVGVDLWKYHNRGVSVLTATTYPLYYYFYPEEWRWDEGLELENVQTLFKRHAGMLEIVNGRYDKPLKAVRMILNELRPIYDPDGGGLTTLTHGQPERSLFG